MEIDQNTYYRYREFSAETLDSLCLDKLYFSNPSYFNDPFDSNPTLECDSSNKDLKELLAFLIKKRVGNEILRNLKKARISSDSANNHALSYARNESTQELKNIAYNSTNPDYDLEISEAESWLLLIEIEHELLRHYERGVCCFSKSYSNPLLWSHYADQHNGICIGYGTERNPVPELNKVDYDETRSIKTSTVINAFIGNQGLAKSDLDRDVLLKKSICWKYENEWRLVGTQGIQDSPLLLKEVTFGLRCNSSIAHSIINALSERNNEIAFYEMHTIRGSYELQRQALDASELNAYLPRTARSGIEIFGSPDNDKSA